MGYGCGGCESGGLNDKRRNDDNHIAKNARKQEIKNPQSSSCTVKCKRRRKDKESGKN